MLNRNYHRQSIWRLFFCFSFLLVCLSSCKQEKNAQDLEIITSKWHFDYEPSCVDLYDNGERVLVGSENGILYVIENENVHKILIAKGQSILKTEFLGNENGLDCYLISMENKGINFVGVDSQDSVRYYLPIIMDDNRLPRKGNRYDARDWTRTLSGEYYFATSNGLWKTDIDTKALLRGDSCKLTRVGNLGVNKRLYKITSISAMDNNIYFAAQDGVWKYDGKNITRLSSEKIRYNCLTRSSNVLTATSDKTIFKIDRDGNISETDNTKNDILYQIQVDDNTTYGIAENQLVVNNKEKYGIRLTKYKKNCFAMKKIGINPVGLYLISGNNLEFLNAHFTSASKAIQINAFAEDFATNTAYAIDEHSNLYQVNDSISKRIGHIKGLPERITQIIVKNNTIYASAWHTLYKVPLDKSWFGGLKAEKLPLFDDKDVDYHEETIQNLFVPTGTDELFIATESHLWNYNLTEPISPENPLRYHIRAKLDDKNDGIAQDLDSFYETLTVQVINEYPSKTNHDFLVGTSNFGILSFSKFSINTLVPASWLGLNTKSVRNTMSIDVEPGNDKIGIKLAIATRDSIYLLSLHNNSSVLTSIPYSAKKVVFMNMGQQLVAMSTLGGVSFFDISGDRLVNESDHLSQLNIFPQVARMQKHLLINTNAGPFIIDKETKKMQLLDMTPKPSKMKDRILLVGCLAIGILFILAASLIAKRYRRRMRDCRNWLDISHKMGDNLFDDQIQELISEMQGLHFNDDAYYAIRKDFEQYNKVKMRECCIREIYTKLPEESRQETSDITEMGTEIIHVVKSIYMEKKWMKDTLNAYRFLIANEQKIGKGNQKMWNNIIKEATGKKPLYNNEIQNEMMDMLKMHPYCDYNTPLLQDIEIAEIDFGNIDLPDECNADYIIEHKDEITRFISEYFEGGSRTKAITSFVEQKEKADSRLAEVYQRITELRHQEVVHRSTLVDYYRNILTYLYYHIFVIESNHVLNYNDKRHVYESYYDFQQQILMLSAILRNDDETKYDMRPSTLIDKLYLKIEGNDSSENSISKFKDKTKALHTAFYKKSSWREYSDFVDLLFKTYSPLFELYGQRPKKMIK